MKISIAVKPCIAAVLLTALAGCNKSAPTVPTPTQNKVEPPMEMTKTQKLGVAVVTDISTHPSLRGARISVGTSRDTVTLDGVVHDAKQKKSAEFLARQKASGYKVINRLKIDPKAAPLPTPRPTLKSPQNKSGQK